MEEVSVDIRELTKRVESLESKIETSRRYYDLYSTILASVEEAVLVNNTDGEILYYNDNFIELWGFEGIVPLEENDVDEIRSRAELLLLNPDEFRLNIRRLHTLKQEVEDVLKFIDGRIIRRYSRPMMQGDKIQGRIWYFRDVTIQHKREETLLMLSKAIESSTAEVYILDEDYRFEFANEASQQNLGYSRDELLGKTPHLINPEMYGTKITEALEQLRDDKKSVCVIESYHKRKCGTTYPIEIKLCKFMISDRLYYNAIVSDISERKKHEEKIGAQINDFKFLAESSSELFSINSINEFYSYLATKMHMLADDSYIVINSFNQKYRHTTVEAIRGINNHLTKALKLLGRDITGLQLPVPKNGLEDLMTNTVSEWKGDLYELTLGKFPKFLMDEVAKISGIKRIFGIGLSGDNLLLAGVSFFSRSTDDLENKSLIETFSLNAAIALQRIMTQNSLEESEDRYRRLFHSAPLGILHYDKNTVITEINDQLIEILGSKRELLEGMNMNAQLKNPILLRALNKALETGESYFEDYYEPVTSAQKAHLRGLMRGIRNSNGEIISVIGIVEDISYRKQAEQKLEDSSSRLKLALKSADIGTWEFDLANNKLSWDKRLYELYGHDPAQPTSQELWLSALHEEDRAFASQQFDEFLEGQHNFDITFRIVKLDDKTIRYLQSNALLLSGSDGKPEKVVGINYDITQRKKLENELRSSKFAAEENEKRFKQIFNSSPDAIFILNEKGDFVEFNQSAMRKLGLSEKHLLNSSVFDIDKTISPEKFRNRLDSIKSKENTIFESTHTNLITGETIPVEISSTLIEYQGEMMRLSLARDISERKKAENSLIEAKAKIEESQKRYKGLFEYNKSVMLLIEPETGKIINANQAACDYYDYNKETILSKNLSEIKLTESSDEIHDRQYSDENKSSLYQHHKLRSGDIRDVDVYSGTISIDGKELIYYIVHDITEQKYNKLRLERGEKIAKTGNWEINLNSFIVFASMGARRIYGFDDSLELSYDYIKSVPLKKYRRRLDEAFKRLVQEDKPYDVEFELQNLQTGKIISVRSIAEYDRLRNIISGTLQDISEEKEIQKKLEMQNKEYEILNHRLKKMNEQLYIAKEKAIEGDRLKSAFLANMSHEIRTPMNAINGFSELLLENDLESDEIREFSNIINNKAKQLLRLINDILDISKIEANSIEIHFAYFNLPIFIENLAQEFSLRCSEKNLAFNSNIKDIHRDYRLYSDKHRLEQILTNLLTNALKFTEEGSISLKCKREQKDNEDFICFEVIDTGVGIIEEDQSIIFERFMQVENNLQHFQDGSGLGLSITKALVEKLGGSISVSSAENEGSTFSVRLPHIEKQSDNITQTEEKPLPAGKFSGKTVLVAEDDLVNFHYINYILSNLNIQVIRAQNGNEAIKCVEECKEINLVLMDIRMPEKNGYEALPQIKTLREDLVVIAQTAFAMVSDRQSCLDAGFDGYLSKPIDVEELVEVLNKYLK